MTRPALDSLEIAEMVYEARNLLQRILSTHCPQREEEGEERGHDQKQSILTSVTMSCCLAFRECFHAFYPSVPLKWFALCQQLQYLDPVSVKVVPTNPAPDYILFRIVKCPLFRCLLNAKVGVFWYQPKFPDFPAGMIYVHIIGTTSSRYTVRVSIFYFSPA